MLGNRQVDLFQIYAHLTYPVLSFKVTSRVNLSTRDEIKLNLS